MIILASTSDKLQLVSSAAATLSVHADWLDNAAGVITPGRANTAISTASTTDIVTAPASTVMRAVKALHVRNTHATIPTDVTVQHTDGAVVAQLYKVTLAAGAALQYADSIGFSVLSPAVGLVQPGALVLIATQTVSSPVAQVDFTGIDATYDEYEIHVIGFQPSVNAWLALRFSQDGGTTFKAGASDYGYTYTGFLASNAASNFGSNGAPFILIGANDVFVGAAYNGSYRIILYRLSSTTLRKSVSWTGSGSGSTAFWSGTGSGTYFADTNAVNALRFILGVAGNIIAGTFVLYGIKK